MPVFKIMKLTQHTTITTEQKGEPRTTTLNQSSEKLKQADIFMPPPAKKKKKKKEKKSFKKG